MRIFLLIFFPNLYLLAQPYTEVYLFDYTLEDGQFELTNPVNLSNNPGKYDNQPSFGPNEEYIYFNSAIDKNPDIIQYQIEDGLHKRLTKTPGGEYSPMVTPDGQYVSAVVLEDNGRQLLWKYDLNGGSAEVVVPDLVIGYYTWVGSNQIVSFVLGEPTTLQLTELPGLKHSYLSENIGRSIHRIPKSELISFIQNDVIYSLDLDSRDTELVSNTLEDSQDMAWMEDGSILMGRESVLYRQTEQDQWNPVADLEKSFGLGKISRLAVGKEKLAVVVME